MDRASRTMMLSSRKNHRTPPTSTLRDPQVATTASEVRATLPSGKRHLILVRTLDIPTRNGTSACDRARILELLLNLVRSETRSTSEASSRHPSRTANAKPFFGCIRTDADKPAQTPITARRPENYPNALCSTRTVDHGSPETK